MANDVALTSSVRSNLTSLQSTNQLLNRTQNRLNTGREVNSVFDDPINFVASTRLNDRAADLGRLLDGISTSLRTVEQANNGVTALQGLLDQAQSVIDTATEALAGSGANASVTGDVDLRGITDVTQLDGVANGDDIILRLTNPDDTDPSDGRIQDLTIDNGGNTIQAATINFGTDQTIDEILAEINSVRLVDPDGTVGGQAFEASLDSEGRLTISALNGGDLDIDFVNAGAPTDDQDNLALANSLGFGDFVRIVDDNTGNTNDVRATVLGTANIQSLQLFADDDPGAGQTSRIARASDNLEDLFITESLDTTAIDNDADSTNAAAFGADDAFIVRLNGGTVGLDAGSAAADVLLINDGAGDVLTVQGLVDGINGNAALNTQIQASFDETTGQINIRALTADVQSVELGIDTGAVGSAVGAFRLGFGAQDNLTAAAVAEAEAVESVGFGASADDLLQAEQQFNVVRDQIDQLVADSDFRGTNLLTGDSLTTFFNPDRSNSIVTSGVDFTASGLGLEVANFANSAAVASFSTARFAATQSVRDFQSAITNDLNIINTRQTFTESTINTLQSGSDDLTLADEEAEGARLLALQTRQTLGITSLSLAAQSQQAILRLF